MSKLQPYLESAYRDGGRGEVVNGVRQYDCWGLVRAVRAELLGMPLLPSYGEIPADDKTRLTVAATREAKAFSIGNPCHGAIATVWSSHTCDHLAICYEIDGRLGVLETGRVIGPRWSPLSSFERRYPRVVYHT